MKQQPVTDQPGSNTASSTAPDIITSTVACQLCPPEFFQRSNRILGRRGYSVQKRSLTSSQIRDIKRELKVKSLIPATFTPFPPPAFRVYLESANKLYLPRHYGINTLGPPEENKLIDAGDNISLTFVGQIRANQQPVISDFINACQTQGGGLISLPCGYGKTIICLNLIATLGKKTLVVVHKEFLLTQWKERIGTFLPGARVGFIQQKKVDIQDKDIVIGMLQSISMKDYPAETFHSFGLVAIDECHHLGAEVFSRALPKIATKYMLGLSATPQRKDGLSCVFEWHLGPMVYCIKKRDPDKVGVHWMEYLCDFPEYCKVEYNNQGRVNCPRMITQICEYLPRTRVIVDLIQEQARLGRNILVLSDRREHLNQIQHLLQVGQGDAEDGSGSDQTTFSVGQYVGGLSQQELKDSETKQIILGTFAMSSEGMDIPSLNTLVLASPKTDVEQSAGRIFRQKQSERTHAPLIIDIVDQISIFQRQSQHRRRLYNRNKYQIVKKCLSHLQHPSSFKKAHGVGSLETGSGPQIAQKVEVGLDLSKCLLEDSDEEADLKA